MTTIRNDKEMDKIELRNKQIKAIAQGLREIADEMENRKIKIVRLNINYDVREKVTDTGNIENFHTGYRTLDLEYCVEDEKAKFIKWFNER